MLSIKTMFWRPATATVIAGVLGVLFTALFLQRTEPRVESAEPAPTAEVPASAARPVVPELAERLDRRLSPLNELILAPGQKLRVDARGITRVEVDVVRVIPPPVLSEDETKLDFVAGEPGLTGVRFHHEGGGGPDLLYVRVAPLHKATRIVGAPKTTGAEASYEVPGANECFELAAHRGLRGYISIRMLTTTAGKVATAYVERSQLGPAEDVEKCLIDIVLHATFSPTDEPHTAFYGYKFPAAE